MIRRVPSRQKNSLVRRERDQGLIRKLAALLICGLVLSSGFVYAAREHFAALQLGYQSENLRRERQQLLEDQRRLFLEREEVASPVKLERAARRLGMQAVQPAQIGPAREQETSPKKNSPTRPTTDSSAPTTNSTGLD